MILNVYFIPISFYFALLILQFSKKNLATFSTLKFDKFVTHNMKAMAKNKKVNIPVT